MGEGIRAWLFDSLFRFRSECSPVLQCAKKAKRHTRTKAANAGMHVLVRKENHPCIPHVMHVYNTRSYAKGRAIKSKILSHLLMRAFEGACADIEKCQIVSTLRVATSQSRRQQMTLRTFISLLSIL